MIRKARKAKRMTQRALAAAADASHPFIAEIELGRRNANDDILTRIAKTLGIEPRILLRASATERARRLEERAQEIRRAVR